MNAAATIMTAESGPECAVPTEVTRGMYYKRPNHQVGASQPRK